MFVHAFKAQTNEKLMFSPKEGDRSVFSCHIMQISKYTFQCQYRVSLAQILMRYCHIAAHKKEATLSIISPRYFMLQGWMWFLKIIISYVQWQLLNRDQVTRASYVNERNCFVFQVTQQAATVAQKKFPEEISELNVYIYEHFWCFSLLWETTQI